MTMALTVSPMMSSRSWDLLIVLALVYTATVTPYAIRSLRASFLDRR